MSNFEMSMGGQGSFGSMFVRGGLRPLEYFLATGLGSRGGPNKASNKLRSSPQSYLSRHGQPGRPQQGD